MAGKFLQILGNIKLYSSYYFAVVSVLAAVWGAFVVYDNWRDNNEEMMKNVNSIIETQTISNKTDSLLLKQQAEMKEQLDEIQGTTMYLEKSYVKRLSNDKTLTKQDFLEYMEGLSFDVKKNSLTGQTPLMSPLLTPNYQENLTVSK